MCELLGISSKTLVETNDILEEFYSHSDMHPDGWGLATFRKKAVSLEKEPIQAIQSEYLKSRLSSPIVSTSLFAHIRKATIGELLYSNCHPFVWDDDYGRTWTLMHNGTLFKERMIAPYYLLEEGGTDSEGILLLIIDAINKASEAKGRPLRGSERFRVVDNVVQELSYGNKLNLLIYDGDQMYVHKNCENTLFVWQKEDFAVFATKPLEIGEFHPLSMNTLLAYKDGKQIRRGKKHDNEYIPKDEDMKMVYAAYAAL